MPATDEDLPECHFKWLKDLQQNPFAKFEDDSELECHSEQAWLKAASEMDMAYYLFTRGQPDSAKLRLSEARNLIQNVPVDLRDGYLQVWSNLSSVITGEPRPEGEEVETAGLLLLKAMADETFRRLYKPLVEELSGYQQCIQKALALLPDNPILQFINAKYTWDAYVSPHGIKAKPAYGSLTVFFDCEKNPRQDLDPTFVKAVLLMALLDVIQDIKQVETKSGLNEDRQFTHRMKHYVELLFRDLVISDKGGALSVGNARYLASQLYYNRDLRNEMAMFLERYVKIYPNNSKLGFFYGRFLCNTGDKAEGMKYIARAVNANTSGTTKALVYIAVIKLREEMQKNPDALPDTLNSISGTFKSIVIQVEEAEEDANFLLQRGGFKYFALQDRQGGVKDWIKLLRMDLARRTLSQYRHNWTGETRDSSPIDIIEEETRAMLEQSSDDAKASYLEVLDLVEAYRRRNSSQEVEDMGMFSCMDIRESPAWKLKNILKPFVDQYFTDHPEKLPPMKKFSKAYSHGTKQWNSENRQPKKPYPMKKPKAHGPNIGGAGEAPEDRSEHSEEQTPHKEQGGELEVSLVTETESGSGTGPEVDLSCKDAIRERSAISGEQFSTKEQSRETVEDSRSGTEPEAATDGSEVAIAERSKGLGEQSSKKEHVRESEAHLGSAERSETSGEHSSQKDQSRESGEEDSRSGTEPEAATDGSEVAIAERSKGLGQQSSRKEHGRESEAHLGSMERSETSGEHSSQKDQSRESGEDDRRSGTEPKAATDRSEVAIAERSKGLGEHSSKKEHGREPVDIEKRSETEPEAVLIAKSVREGMTEGSIRIGQQSGLDRQTGAPKDLASQVTDVEYGTKSVDPLSWREQAKQPWEQESEREQTAQPLVEKENGSSVDGEEKKLNETSISKGQELENHSDDSQKSSSVTVGENSRKNDALLASDKENEAVKSSPQTPRSSPTKELVKPEHSQSATPATPDSQSDSILHGDLLMSSPMNISGATKEMFDPTLGEFLASPSKNLNLSKVSKAETASPKSAKSYYTGEILNSSFVVTSVEILSGSSDSNFTSQSSANESADLSKGSADRSSGDIDKCVASANKSYNSP